jgi:hypothetical protein
MKTIAIAGIAVIALIAIAGAMPMSSCTPEQVADILLQPVKADIAAHRAALVAGDITTEEYMTYLAITKVQLEVKLVLLDMLIGSELKANEYREALCCIFPWRVRAAGNMPRIIGGAHL